MPPMRWWRRSAPLQATHDALPPRALMHGDELKKLGLQSAIRSGLQ